MLEGNDLRFISLAEEAIRLINKNIPNAKTGLDIGCQRGQITELVSESTGMDFYGIEMDKSEVEKCSSRIHALVGKASSLPFDNEYFDVVMLISVLEHIPPEELRNSINEVYRVLKPGGFCIGQIPNMNFPIEIHSHLPFQQFLPRKIGNLYLRTFTKYKKSEWYRTSKRKLVNLMNENWGKGTTFYKYKYSKKVYPRKFRFFYPLLRFATPDYFFYFKK